MHPSPSPPSPSRPKKVDTQRQYREKEGICFNTLREVIKELTGEELPTRQEILKKAIELLLVTSDTVARMQIDAQVIPSASHTVNSPADLTLDHADDLAPLEAYNYPQNWHPRDTYTAQPYYGPLYGQLDHSNAEYRLNNGSYQEYDRNSSPWYHHPQM